jgi:hypothetical protein
MCDVTWETTYAEALDLIEREVAADPAYRQWLDDLDARDLLGSDPGPEGSGLCLDAEHAVSDWRCEHCGADVGWGCGVTCLRCGAVVVPF